MTPLLTIVVAMNNMRVIGVNNQLPWHIPEDLKYFKQVTFGKPVIMGRKTFDSIGRALPGRKNIVISRDSNWSHPGVTVYNSLNAAIIDNQDFPELCIIGGGEIFKQALPLCQKMHITIVEVDVNNPTVFFPEFNLLEWTLIKQEKIITTQNIKCSFNEYVRHYAK